MADEHEVKLVARLTPVVDKRDVQDAAEEMRSDAQDALDKRGIQLTPVLNTEDVKKAVDDIKGVTDIELTPTMDTSSVMTASEQLRTSIQQIFDASAGEQLDSKFQSMQDRMEQVRRKSEELSVEIEKLSNTKIKTEEYRDLEYVTADATKQLVKLTDAQREAEEYGGKRATSSSAYKKRAAEIQELRDTIRENNLLMEEMRKEGTAYVAGSETDKYKKLVDQQELLNNKMRIYVLQWEEANARMNQASQQSVGTGDNMNKNISSANRAIFGLSGSLRGIARLIPGVSSTAITSIALVSRSVLRLSSLTREQLLGALRTVQAALEKIIATIISNPVLLALTAILAGLAVIVKVTKDIKKQFEWVERTLKRIANLVTGAFKKGVSSLAKLSISLIGNVIKFITNGIKAVINRVKSLKSVITEYLKLMAQWRDGDNAVNKSLSNLTSSLTYLKGAFTSAFAPILTFVEPTLTRLMDQLADATSQIGMFIAKLTGAKSFQKAVRQQKDYAKSLSNVSKSAKEASKSLAAYDKLQVINQQHAEDATKDSDTGIDWEEVALSDFQLPDWLTNLYELGQKAGTKLRDMLQGIPWSSVQNGATKAAKGVSDLIDGFFSVEELGSTVGNTVAQVANSIVSAYNVVVGETEWQRIGDQIGDAIISIFTEFDFTELGKAISRTVNAIFSMLYRALFRLSGEDIGSAFTNFLNAVLDVDWHTIQVTVGTIGRLLGTLLQNVFTEDNFKKVAETVSKLIETIFLGLEKFDHNIDFGKIGGAIASGINTLIDGIKFEEDGKTVDSLGQSFVKLVASAINGINWDAIIQGIATFLDQIDWTKIADSLKGLSETIRNAVESLWKELEANGVWDEWIDIIGDVLAEKKNWEKLFKRIKSSVIRELVLDKLKEIFVQPFKSYWNAILFSLDFVEAAGLLFTDILDAIEQQDWGRIIKDIFGIIWNLLMAWLSFIMIPLVAFIDNMREWFGTGIQDIIDSVSHKWNKFWEGFAQKATEVWTLIKTGSKAPLNSLLSMVESFINHIIDSFNDMIRAVNTLQFDVPGWIPKIGGQHFGLTLSQLANVSLPRLSQGAVIPPNKEFAAILGDQKNGTNIETPLDTMVQAFKQAMVEMGGNHAPIILQLSGKTVAQVVWDEEAKRYKQTGRYQFS